MLFVLSDDALYVANVGKPFTRKGVIGICASHLGEKGEIPPLDIYDKNKNLVSQIREGEIKTYENPNRLNEDKVQEKETSLDYGGRFVWELLQNADDAMGVERSPAELIGTKGLGFKSVLEITEEPEIYSGPFNFKFSPDKTQELLRKLWRDKKIHADPPRLTFRIPHSSEPRGKVLKGTSINRPFQV